jgi:hypothetical protein
MSCVTGFDKRRLSSSTCRFAFAVTIGLFLTAAEADAQQFPQQFQQAPGQATQMQAPPQTMPAGYPQQNYQQQISAQPSQERLQLIGQWFKNYDDIRRKAQMNPAERAKADALMSKALSMFIPGEEKTQAKALLSSLVARYAQAVDEFKRLPLYPETERLHRGYYQYFTSARQLFSDYLTVQQNPLSTDQSGNPVAGTLMARKQNLEGLDQANKAIDSQLRAQFGIPPYQY